MSMMEFMKELEYLLSDIPEEDKADAIGYYRDYLAEAGPENEEEVIKSFGSPERIAAMIRSDLAGTIEDGGEFTDRGFEDHRFLDPNHQVAKRYDLPDTVEESRKPHSDEAVPPHANRNVKLVLWIILIIVASPILFGIGGGVAGVVSGFLGILLAVVVVLGVLTFAAFVCGIVMMICGIVTMVISPVSGVMLVGIAFLFLGIAMGLLAVCGVFYGRFLPFLVRSAVNGISRLLYGRRRRS